MAGVGSWACPVLRCPLGVARTNAGTRGEGLLAGRMVLLGGRVSYLLSRLFTGSMGPFFTCFSEVLAIPWLK